MKTMDGPPIAKRIFGAYRGRVEALVAQQVVPTLAIVVPTDNEATAWYVRSLVKAAERWGIRANVVPLDHPDGPTLFMVLDHLSADPAVHAVMCQTPLPEGVSLRDVGAHICPEKDVDGANPVSLGRLAVGLAAFPPATAEAVLEVLHANAVPLRGRHVVVVGRSTVVGKPAALLLLAKDATVTVCHSRTADLAATCRQGDILVAAVGQPGLVTGDCVKDGAVVVDVGTNPTPDGGLVGDVDVASVTGKVAALTPVPGGVGAVTTALLMRHVVEAAEASVR